MGKRIVKYEGMCCLATSTTMLDGGLDKDKWKREENNKDWEAKLKMDNVSPDFQDFDNVILRFILHKGMENGDIVYGENGNAVNQGS